MSLPVRPEQRRLLRLLSFFEPYPSFVVRVKDPLSVPVEISPLSDPRAPGAEKFLVAVHPLLVTNDAPHTTERLVLAYALSWMRERRVGERDSDIDSEYREIEGFFSDRLPRRPVTRVLPKQETLPLVEPAAPVRAAVSGDAELLALWRRVRAIYFPERPDIDSYRVVWSKREHTSTLASCNAERRRVSVARAMQRPDALPHLEALLYHEMCHAVLGKPEVRDGRRIIHGSDFKRLEQLHPGIPALDAWIKQGGWRQVVRETRKTLRPTTGTSYTRTASGARTNVFSRWGRILRSR